MKIFNYYKRRIQLFFKNEMNSSNKLIAYTEDMLNIKIPDNSNYLDVKNSIEEHYSKMKLSELENEKIKINLRTYIVKDYFAYVSSLVSIAVAFLVVIIDSVKMTEEYANMVVSIMKIVLCFIIFTFIVNLFLQYRDKFAIKFKELQLNCIEDIINSKKQNIEFKNKDIQ